MASELVIVGRVVCGRMVFTVPSKGGMAKLMVTGGELVLPSLMASSNEPTPVPVVVTVRMVAASALERSSPTWETINVAASSMPQQNRPEVLMAPLYP